MKPQVFLIAGILYLATNVNHAAKLCAVQDMEQNDENWEVLKPSMIRSISQYVKP